ncbi:hypothetical protein BAUCODRAFT_187353 [Baudoinia panamericana UAMH 10762]|uniref:Uncharacterized protein n=1 Tax=Baudoinia panamericana (strain UAMH 10762) TaxID=717646 RepID=M2NMV7_BAUPA|nr:uncharacterized protein BAUCODRAFT_187353 [Baudoinia panamericana UAMH 10762]EMD00870.1 hypothetical protein BAUCODRAFT_187353 [Baudoinia panamericana UAMH 10762]
MRSYGQVLSAATALTLVVNATPIAHNTTLRARDETFKLFVYNNCPFVKEVSTYTVTADFQMVLMSPPTNIQPHGGELVISTPFHATGMRLTGHAEWTNQWAPTLLFEYGYSAYMGVEGTAYDISMMAGSDPDIGMGVWPIENGQGSGSCAQKIAWPWNAPLGQAWTNPDQDRDGSPADTVCYKGKTDFKVVYCP